MATQSKKKTNRKPPSQRSSLKGWQQIAEFLGQPISVAQRWAKTGMPTTRQGRNVIATPDELHKWLGREAGGEPLHVARPEIDLASELKRGLAYVKDQKSSERVQKKSSKRG
jgi:hypothetical protein